MQTTIEVKEAGRTFQYGEARLGAFSVHHEVKTGVESKKPVRRVNTVEVDGQQFQTSPRFWNSLLSRYGFSDNIFNYFDHKEVFDRIVQRKGDTQLRYTAELNGDRKPVMLAIVDQKTKVLDVPTLLHTFNNHGGTDLVYSPGVFLSRFLPHGRETIIDVGGDKHTQRFAVEVPIDGYGKMKTFLEMLRQVCVNGAIAMAPAFTSTIQTGGDAIYALGRALQSFDAPEGYGKLRERFEMAQNSWASVRECNRLIKLALKNPSGQTNMRKITQTTGDFCQIYGLSSMELVPHKKQALLPARCTCYDLINLCSEFATHYSEHEESKSYQAFIGTLLSESFDLEGTAEGDNKEFADFLVGARSN